MATFIQTLTAAHGLLTAAAAAAVTDADLSLSDIATNDVSITAHGFAPKAPNDATKFLDGTGAYSTPTTTPGGSAGGDLAGTYPNPTVSQSSTAFALTADISPSALGSDQNDWSPTSLSTASTIRASASVSNVNITGLAGGADGRIIVLHNVGTSNTLTLKNESASSTAANRYAIGNDLVLQPKQSCTLQYDATSSRWRVVGAWLNPLLPANNLSDLASASTARTNLGLGTSATVDTGTSGTKVPLLDGTNTWSAAQIFDASITIDQDGFYQNDTDKSHSIQWLYGTNLSANRVCTITTPDAAFSIAWSGSVTIPAGTLVANTRTVSAGGIATGGGDLSANRTITVTAATQSDMETGTSTSVAVVPGVVQNHPGVAKCWCYWNQTGTQAILASHNITTLSDAGVGLTDVTIGTDFSSANWCPVTGGEFISGVSGVAVDYSNVAAGSIRIDTTRDSAFVDAPKVSFAGFGDQ